MKPHRIAAGGIVIRDDTILLVRYGTGPGSYLVGPGGAVEETENIEQAVVRETMEETGITVRAAEGCCGSRIFSVRGTR